MISFRVSACTVTVTVTCPIRCPQHISPYCSLVSEGSPASTTLHKHHSPFDNFRHSLPPLSLPCCFPAVCTVGSLLSNRCVAGVTFIVSLCIRLYFFFSLHLVCFILHLQTCISAVRLSNPYPPLRPFYACCWVGGWGKVCEGGGMEVDWAARGTRDANCVVTVARFVATMFIMLIISDA